LESGERSLDFDTLLSRNGSCAASLLTAFQAVSKIQDAATTVRTHALMYRVLQQDTVQSLHSWSAVSGRVSGLIPQLRFSVQDGNTEAAQRFFALMQDTVQQISRGLGGLQTSSQRLAWEIQSTVEGIRRMTPLLQHCHLKPREELSGKRLHPLLLAAAVAETRTRIPDSHSFFNASSKMNERRLDFASNNDSVSSLPMLAAGPVRQGMSLLALSAIANAAGRRDALEKALPAIMGKPAPNGGENSTRTAESPKMHRKRNSNEHQSPLMWGEVRADFRADGTPITPRGIRTRGRRPLEAQAIDQKIPERHPLAPHPAVSLLEDESGGDESMDGASDVDHADSDATLSSVEDGTGTHQPHIRDIVDSHKHSAGTAISSRTRLLTGRNEITGTSVSSGASMTQLPQALPASGLLSRTSSGADPTATRRTTATTAEEILLDSASASRALDGSEGGSNRFDADDAQEQSCLLCALEELVAVSRLLEVSNSFWSRLLLLIGDACMEKKIAEIHLTSASSDATKERALTTLDGFSGFWRSFALFTDHYGDAMQNDIRVGLAWLDDPQLAQPSTRTESNLLSQGGTLTNRMQVAPQMLLMPHAHQHPQAPLPLAYAGYATQVHNYTQNITPVSGNPFHSGQAQYAFAHSSSEPPMQQAPAPYAYPQQHMQQQTAAHVVSRPTQGPGYGPTYGYQHAPMQQQMGPSLIYAAPHTQPLSSHGVVPYGPFPTVGPAAAGQPFAMFAQTPGAQTYPPVSASIGSAFQQPLPPQPQPGDYPRGQ
jgi:hypothetical protein